MRWNYMSKALRFLQITAELWSNKFSSLSNTTVIYFVYGDIVYVQTFIIIIIIINIISIIIIILLLLWWFFVHWLIYFNKQQIKYK